MENQSVGSNPEKRRKLLVLPLVVIPFLTLGFWALGGGRADEAKAQKQSPGLNLQLPGARLKDDREQTKLSFYEAAEKDTAAWKGVLKKNPYYDVPSFKDSLSTLSYDPFTSHSGGYHDPSEERIYKTLQKVNQSFRSGPYKADRTVGQDMLHTQQASSLSSEDVDRLERMMKSAEQGGASDPEMDQLNGMMDKILDIQHPQRVAARLKAHVPSDATSLSIVKKEPGGAPVSLLETSQKGTGDAQAFYDGGGDRAALDQNAIEATVHEKQSLVSGSVMKIRLLNDLFVEGTLIPKGNVVYGIASLQGDRLDVAIRSIRYGRSLFPVKLDVYDMDGLKGIFIPGTITSDVAGSSADNAAQSLELTALDPSLKGQIATAGIHAAKNLLTKKAKRVRVTIPAGYQLLLKPETIL